MSKRDTRLLLEDIIASVNYIEQFIAGYDLPLFEADRKTLDATIRNLEIVGEASKLLPEDFKQQYPNITWRQIIGLRNVVIHVYFRVDAEALWKVVTQELPKFKTQIEDALAHLNQQTADHSSKENRSTE